MKRLSMLLLVSATAFYGCKQTEEMASVTLSEVVLEQDKTPSRPIYNPSETRSYDLIHTKLDVKFDWSKKHLLGTANLTLRPYFYESKLLVLDAKGFDIHAVALVKDDVQLPLDYDYDGWELSIKLDKVYSRTESFEVFIDYTAKPDELKTKGGSAAITGDKGLYFINADGSDPNTRPQIWTQGETEASSCWFPTIDAPNERTTQEISITVQDKHVSLSNGILVSTTDNKDGTHTDYWKMDKPHAPYLFMMAVGPFSIVDDKWRDIEVDYYVEEEEAQYAMLNFGKTPEMLEFFSEKLGVVYPWSKYHQVVVRDYVSGAMENTTGVIFGDFMYENERSYLDGNGEDVVSHELFHHWFGDLVTCESWANLPLNESFATYGEYLWREYKYGRESADYHGMNDMNGYFQEAEGKQVDMIRFDYKDKEDMFDGHSYAKGGRILHMLRKYLGDEAFFLGLQKYLQDNAYQAVEIHQLRLAMEEVCGEDLNWFFNQWFFASGHPELEIEYEYKAEKKVLEIELEQEQKLAKTPLYKLPLDVDVYTSAGVERHRIVFEEVEKTFEIPVSEKPRWVNVDAEKMLLGKKDEDKEDSDWAAQYREGPLFLDRLEALKALKKTDDKALLKSIINEALADEFWYIRSQAIQLIKKLEKEDELTFKDKLISMANKDEKAAVRAAAVRGVSKYYDDIPEEFYVEKTNDLSYETAGAALAGLHENYPEKAYEVAQYMEPDADGDLVNSIAEIYVENGSPKHMEFFNKTFDGLSGFSLFGFSSTYSDYIAKQSITDIKANLHRMERVAKTGEPWFIRYIGMQMLTDLQEELEDEKTESSEETKAFVEELKAKIKEIKEAETNAQLRKFYGLDKEEDGEDQEE